MKKLLNSLPLLVASVLLTYSCTRSQTNAPAFLLPSLFSRSVPDSEVWRVAETKDAIHDGDTMRLTNGSKELRIRLCGIDSPELSQPLGFAARDYLRSLVAKSDGTVYVTSIEKDRYGRTVAELLVPLKDKDDDVFLNGEMVRAGYAWHYQQDSGNCPNKNAIAALKDRYAVGTLTAKIVQSVPFNS
jgi:endonuclease YncB( thermonuclease family)